MRSQQYKQQSIIYLRSKDTDEKNKCTGSAEMITSGSFTAKLTAKGLQLQKKCNDYGSDNDYINNVF